MPAVKLDSKETIDKVKRFLIALKQNEQINPFLNIEDIVRFGIYDFCYINKKTISFDIIQKKLKEYSYSQLKDFIDDITLLFTTVSDYVFSDDPLQEICQSFIDSIGNFETEFINHYKTIADKQKNQKYQSKKNEQINNDEEDEGVTQENLLQLSQKLDMLYTIDNQARNPSGLRMKAAYFRLGYQRDNQFIINITPNSLFWKVFAPQ